MFPRTEIDAPGRPGRPGHPPPRRRRFHSHGFFAGAGHYGHHHGGHHHGHGTGPAVAAGAAGLAVGAGAGIVGAEIVAATGARQRRKRRHWAVRSPGARPHAARPRAR